MNTTSLRITIPSPFCHLVPGFVALREWHTNAEAVSVEAADTEALVGTIARAIVGGLGLGAGQLAARRALAFLEHLSWSALWKRFFSAAHICGGQCQDIGGCQSLKKHQDYPRGPHDCSSHALADSLDPSFDLA